MGRLAVEDWPALQALVERVERGETVEITRGGAPVARLEAQPAALDAAAVDRVALMRALRRDLILGDVDVRAAIDDGRE